jgi:hypothetical protein
VWIFSCWRKRRGQQLEARATNAKKRKRTEDFSWKKRKHTYHPVAMAVPMSKHGLLVSKPLSESPRQLPRINERISTPEVNECWVEAGVQDRKF